MELTDVAQEKEAPPPEIETQHVHCMGCVSRRCMVRPEAGKACALMGCALVCGAVFHTCKAGEHRLLCPQERVPCLNSGFGCPFTVARNKIAEHLEVCPASVVCCTMEWNRWPVSYADRTSYESLSKDVDEVEQLDMALALQDQRMLLESLKVVLAMSRLAEKRPSVSEKVPLASRLAREKIANGINGLDEESYSKLYQATAETSRSLVAALGILNSATKDMGPMSGAVTDRDAESNGEFHGEAEDEALHVEKVKVMDSGGQELDCKVGAVGAVGAVGGRDHSPEDMGDEKMWMEQNEVFELLEVMKEKITKGIIMKDKEEPLCNGFYSSGAQNELDLDEMELRAGELGYTDANRYRDSERPDGTSEVPEDSIAMETQEPPRAQPPPLPLPIPLPGDENEEHSAVEFEEKWFGQKLQNLQALRGMGMLAFSGQRDTFTDPFPIQAKLEDKAVDTFDLEGDSPGGQGICDSRFADGYSVEIGTQTFSFPSAILATSTMVGDIASASACDHANPQLTNPSPFHPLRLDLVLECVARDQTKQRSMFTFVCGQLFKRDEFASHFKNVHGDIHAGLNGWMERRCPLAYYGCTFSQRRFCPSTQGSKIVHDRHLRSFGVQPSPVPRVEPAPGDGGDRLSGLPFEVLQHVASFLDGFGLCQLSRVSRTMRDLCASLLQTRGMVVLLWEKRPLGNAGCPSWQIKDKVGHCGMGDIIHMVTWLETLTAQPTLTCRSFHFPSLKKDLQYCAKIVSSQKMFNAIYLGSKCIFAKKQHN
uniref:F-box protein 30a n=1 Tax=Paramormyrops kingsleyae TaxID=1676925 RepID=A0A3B3SVC6_9TELE